MTAAASKRAGPGCPPIKPERLPLASRTADGGCIPFLKFPCDHAGGRRTMNACSTLASCARPASRPVMWPSLAETIFWWEPRQAHYAEAAVLVLTLSNRSLRNKAMLPRTQKSPSLTGYATTEETKAFSSRFPGLSTHPPAGTHFRYDPSMSDYLPGGREQWLMLANPRLRA